MWLIVDWWLRCCRMWLFCSGELFDFLVVHGSMKEKEARQKFRQVLVLCPYSLFVYLCNSLLNNCSTLICHLLLWRCWLGVRKGSLRVNNWVVECWCSYLSGLHMAKLMPLPLTVSCFSKIQIGFTFLVPAHLDSPGQRSVKRMCVCVCVWFVSFAKNVVSMCICEFVCLRVQLFIQLLFVYLQACVLCADCVGCSVLSSEAHCTSRSQGNAVFCSSTVY